MGRAGGGAQSGDWSRASGAEACPRPAPGPRSQTRGPGLSQTPPIRSAQPQGKRDPSLSGTPPLASAPPGLCECVPVSAMGAFLPNQIPSPSSSPNRCAWGRGFCGSHLPRPRSGRRLGKCEGAELTEENGGRPRANNCGPESGDSLAKEQVTKPRKAPGLPLQDSGETKARGGGEGLA